MPATTPKGFPYPLGSDVPDVPADVYALATAVDAKIGLGASAYATVLTAIPNGVNTVVNLGAASFDPAGMRQAGTPNRLTIVEAGYYRAFAGIVYAANATGVRGILARLNGGAIYPVRHSANALSAGAHYLTATGGVRAYVAGDYLELLATQTSTIALNTAPGIDETWLALVKVSG